MIRFLFVLMILAGASTAGPRCASQERTKWPTELKVGRFDIHADFNLADQDQLLSELTTFPGELTSALTLPASDQPIHIVLFGSAREYRRYMDAYFPHLPARRAFFIQDKGPGMLFTHAHGELVNDLRHEITHALLNEGNRELPLWLDEGMAEYFEVSGDRRFRDNRYLQPVAARASKGLVPSLKQLESISTLQQFTESHYRDSWSWVHFLMHRSADTRQLLVRFLHEQRSGAESLPVSRQLQHTLKDVPAEYQSHFQSLQSTQYISTDFR
jgi:hypothetical protein